MYQTLDAIVDPSGTVRLLEVLHIDRPCRAFVTLLEDPCAGTIPPVNTASGVLKFLE